MHYQVMNGSPASQQLVGTWQTPRQQWIQELALAQSDSLNAAVSAFVNERSIKVAVVKEPEVGLCMVPAQIGGVGEAFGLGEVTVARCVVEINGDIGVGYVLGRDHMHAYNVAVGDALLQGRWFSSFESEILNPVRQLRATKETERERVIDLTRVDFETMVRANG
jgi:alpha-D-ribose 1-methylphosphonate 5-triphosphate synthase subunit PhnG